MKRKIILAVAFVLFFATVTVGSYLYSNLTPFAVTKVSEDVYLARGFGGNVAILRTDEGAVVVDSMTFGFQGDWIQRAAKKFGGGPVQAVINTHYHQDHTHGNPAFTEVETFVATEKTREHMLALDGDYWKGSAARTVPGITFTHDHLLEIGGKTVLCMHKGRGHTDGDLVVLFVEDRVLVSGDLVFNRAFPNIDLEAGGSIPAWIKTLDAVAELGFDKVIPGHGELTDRDGIRTFQDFLRELWDKSTAAAVAGKSLAQTLAEVKLERSQGYSVFHVPFVITLDHDFAVTRGWQEATGKSGD